MLNESLDGEILRISQKKEGVFRPESTKLIQDIANAVAPEIKRVTDLIQDKIKAERMIVLNCIRRVNQSKSSLRNYFVSNVFSAIALSIFLQSEHPEKIGNLFYERRSSGKDNNYDVLNIDSWTEKNSANLPAPMLDFLFMRTLAEKVILINYEPSFSHNRYFDSRLKSVTDVAQLVGDVFLEISDTVDIKMVIESVYGKESDVTQYWEKMSQLIKSTKQGLVSKAEFYQAIIIDEDEKVTDAL